MGSNKRKLYNNPDYQRLLRYRRRRDDLEKREKYAYERCDISDLNLARGLLYNIREQIKELEGMLELQSEEPVC